MRSIFGVRNPPRRDCALILAKPCPAFVAVTTAEYAFRLKKRELCSRTPLVARGEPKNLRATQRFQPAAGTRGLTLIELLVAMAIAVLLIGVVFLIHGTALDTIRIQTVRRESLEPAEDALDALQRDIMCSLALRGSTNPAFVLRPGDEGRPDTLLLRLFTAWPGNGSNDWRAYGVREVEYSLRAQSATGSYALIRQCRPFRTADSAFAPAEETLGPLLADMRILVYDGKAWTNAWETASGIPQAAQITLQIELPSGPRTLTLETLIPAGHCIKAPTQADQRLK